MCRDELARIRILGQLVPDGLHREGAERLDAHERHIRHLARLALGRERVVVLAAAQHDAPHPLRIERGRIGQHRLEVCAGGKVRVRRHAVGQAEQRLGRHDQQRLAEVAYLLAAQGVEVLGRGGRVDDLQVDRVPVRAGFARVRHLQEALNAAGAVLGGGPIVAVGQQHHQPIADHPFRCGETPDDSNSGNVSMMIWAPLKKSPNWASHSTRLFGLSMAMPYSNPSTASSERMLFASSNRPAFGVAAAIAFSDFVRLLIDQHRVALGKRPPAHIFPAQPHVEALVHEAADGERLGRGPIDPLPLGNPLPARINPHALLADVAEQPVVDARVPHRHLVAGLLQAGPLSAEVAPLRLVLLAGRQLGGQIVSVAVRDRVHVLLVEHARLDQPAGVPVRDGGPAVDHPVQQRVGHGRIVQLVVAPAPVAVQIDEEIFAKLLPVLDRQLRDAGQRLRVVAVHVHHRGHDRLGQIGHVPGAAAALGRRREADLIVHDQVHRALDLVVRHGRHHQTLLSRPESPRVTQSHRELSRAVLSRSESFEVIWSRLESPRIAWSRPESAGVGIARSRSCLKSAGHIEMNFLISSTLDKMAPSASGRLQFQTHSERLRTIPNDSGRLRTTSGLRVELVVPILPESWMRSREPITKFGKYSRKWLAMSHIACASAGNSGWPLNFLNIFAGRVPNIVVSTLSLPRCGIPITTLRSSCSPADRNSSQ
uniref:Uncharacterized protein n=1 Tax=Anopheles coluzzii TaxID=1518534 RepID=A0A8W7PUJ8_ANOCL